MFYAVKPNEAVAPHPEQRPKKVPSYRKSMWSQSEDQLLMNAVTRFGTNNWGVVASEVQGRTGKQCRERWAGILNPALAKQPWSEEEDEMLKQLHAQYGNKWALISLHIKGRSTIALRNRWSWHMRHAQTMAKAASQQNIMPQMPPIRPGQQQRQIAQQQPMPITVPQSMQPTLFPQQPVRVVIPQNHVQEGIDDKARWAGNVYQGKFF